MVLHLGQNLDSHIPERDGRRATSSASTSQEPVDSHWDFSPHTAPAQGETDAFTAPLFFPQENIPFDEGETHRHNDESRSQQEANIADVDAMMHTVSSPELATLVASGLNQLLRRRLSQVQIAASHQIHAMTCMNCGNTGATANNLLNVPQISKMAATALEAQVEQTFQFLRRAVSSQLRSTINASVQQQLVDQLQPISQQQTQNLSHNHPEWHLNGPTRRRPCADQSKAGNSGIAKRARRDRKPT